ncbi:TRM11 family SAM-dependent methyltransferase [Nocardiopsis trehalosi]|uniref:TRM11 family SAM-dependent methyltransferase n=1 Tax=Nocardiopsis trehalosi TaxID=109329 RepID=UPI000AAA5EC2|nr:DNA methyltransferase [Nocardiopsis trehalosi]
MKRSPRMPSVWATGQVQAKGQRTGRYSRLSLEHPAKMLPAIARHAIRVFTEPGDLVLDPMCGIGTTLVEAVHLGREAVGIELEAKWASIARINLGVAAVQGAEGTGEVHIGDAARVAGQIAPAVSSAASLLLTSPPYGAMTHGLVRTRRDGAAKVAKWSHRYNRDKDRANLAYQRPEELLASFTTILAECRPLLKPGAHVVITARPFRVKGELVDFPARVARAVEVAGLVPVGRCVALLCALRDGGVVSRTSFFQAVETRRLRDAGTAAHVIQHEDVLIFQNPPLSPVPALLAVAA